MNTKNQQNQKNQQQKAQQKHGPKKQGQNPNILQNNRKYQDHENPETRLFR